MKVLFCIFTQEKWLKTRYCPVLGAFEEAEKITQFIFAGIGVENKTKLITAKAKGDDNLGYPTDR